MGEARQVMDRLTATVVESQDVDSMLEIYADDAVLDTPDGKVQGRENIREWWQPFLQSFSDAQYEPISKIEAGNKAVDEGFFIGTHTEAMMLPSGETLPPTGKKIRMRSCDVATVENGKIKEHHVYFDELDFMRQLGLAE